MFAARHTLWMLVALLATSNARADEGDKAACMASHGDAQILRHANHLQAARAELVKCAASQCPTLVASDCTRWLAEVEQQQPSIVVAASGPSGQPIVDGTVEIDGKVAVTTLDGTAIDVDPGEHALRVRSVDGRSSVLRFVARESEKARLVRIQLPTPEAAPASERRRPAARRSDHKIPIGSWALGGIAIASAVPWAIFGILGWTQKANLDSTCKGTCAVGSIEDVQRDFNIADLAGAVTLAALAAAVIVALVAPSHSRALSTTMTSGGSLMSFTQRF